MDPTTSSMLETPEKEQREFKRMTPNTRKRKSRLAEDLTHFIESWQIRKKRDILGVVLLSLKKLELSEKLEKKFQKNKYVTGRKMASFQARKIIWDFYHDQATPSTNTSRPAKQKVSERNNIQTGLDFVDNATVILQRGKQFYENNWMMLHETYQELYKNYIEKYCNNKVSHGTFYALKPFYIRTETDKDIEICCYKLHLHARWVIEAIIKYAERQETEVPFENYATFFQPSYPKL